MLYRTLCSLKSGRAFQGGLRFFLEPKFALLLSRDLVNLIQVSSPVTISYKRLGSQWSYFRSSFLEHETLLSFCSFVSSLGSSGLKCFYSPKYRVELSERFPMRCQG